VHSLNPAVRRRSPDRSFQQFDFWSPHHFATVSEKIFCVSGFFIPSEHRAASRVQRIRNCFMFSMKQAQKDRKQAFLKSTIHCEKNYYTIGCNLFLFIMFE